jgi:hypothetical protein
MLEESCVKQAKRSAPDGKTHDAGKAKPKDYEARWAYVGKCFFNKYKGARPKRRNQNEE